MKHNWTSDQLDAINSTGGSVLVSAAAGSGKTSVLVERIIKLITDPVCPTDIDKLLIVTFTRSAAQEMKIRLSSKIFDMIQIDPLNRNLRRQQRLLKIAQIGTIDSFCINMVKENFFKLGISPNFKIAQKYEISVLKKKAMESTLNLFYENKTDEFKIISDFFSNEKNDSGLEAAIEKIYEFMLSVPRPKMWIRNQLNLYEDQNNVHIWEKVIFENAKNMIVVAENLALSAVKTLKLYEDVSNAYLFAIEDDVLNISYLKKLIFSENQNEATKFLASMTYAKLGSIKNLQHPEIKEFIKFTRDYYKDILKKLKEEYFTTNFEEDCKAKKILCPVIKAVLEITNVFMDEIAKLKAEKNVFEFSDFSHMAVQLLTDYSKKIPQPSALAKEYSAQYREVMVDEYQDINDVQDEIFRMITDEEKNLFMVGDVKQSIYRFRNSSPKIFLNKKNKFNLFDSQNEKYPSKVILSQNFRSSKSVIEFVNFIFKNIMSEKVGDIEYSSEEFLNFQPSIEQDKCNCTTEIKIIDVEKSEESADVFEARAIANTISKMIANKYLVSTKEGMRPAMFSDFCILLRSLKNKAEVYEKEFAKHKLPLKIKSEKNFLMTKEISTILSFLRVINNPLQDVPLIAIMLSPLFSFTLDEIVEIKAQSSGGAFYFSVKQYADKGNEKSKYLLERINHYRMLSCNMSCDALLSEIYSDTNYPSICAVMDDGDIRKANLIRLMNYARDFEMNFHRGLVGFLGFIDKIIEKGEDLEPAHFSDGNENCIKIMTIHNSKGLEFPICILAGCSGYMPPNTDNVHINSFLGVGTKIKSLTENLKYDNVICRAIKIQNKCEEISEELRVLYVALTRAKQKLVVTMALKNLQKSIVKCFMLSEFLNKGNSYLVQNMSSFAKWILLCLGKSSLRNEILNQIECPEMILDNSFEKLDLNVEILSTDSLIEKSVNDDKNVQPKNQKKTISKDEFDIVFGDIKKRINFFKSQNSESDFMPAKIAASTLSGTDSHLEYVAASVPQFLCSSLPVTSVEKGNAMHKFMCWANLKNICEFGIEYEIARLKNKKFLNEKEMLGLDLMALKRLVRQRIFKRIIDSSNMLREHRFSLKIDGHKLFPNLEESKINDDIIVEGAIDCAFEENGEMVIIDYKTDITRSAETLFKKYLPQLKMYKYAIEEIEKIRVKEIGIYSFYKNEDFSNLIEKREI